MTTQTMLFGTVLSGFLFLLPIILTSGIYIGVRYQNVVSVVRGKIPPGVDPSNPYSPQAPKSIVTNRYCSKFDKITPYPMRYTLNPNIWGDPDNTGFVCMNVTTKPFVDQRTLYSTNWSATWSFPPGSSSQPVHAYPNAMLTPSTAVLPIQVSSLDDLVVDVKWTYAPGNEVALVQDNDALTASDMNANVALDMFFSNDKDKAANTSAASYEVMVWFGTYGASTSPLGYTGPQGVQSQDINGTTFNLYYGANGLGQQVFTWVASKPVSEFVGNLSPLINSLSTIAAAPQDDAYLGSMAFGSELFYSRGNMTFSVERLKLDVIKS